MDMKHRIFAYTVVAFLIMVLSIQLAFAASSGTSGGTATVTGATPAITSPKLTTTAGADKNDTALTVKTEYYANFTIADANSLADLKNVTILIWYNGTGGALKTDSDAQRNHYTYTWVESTDTWSCPLSVNYINTGNCADPGAVSALSTYEFRLSFNLSKVANYSNTGTYTGWQINCTVYDDELHVGTFGEGTGGRLQFGVTSYFEISVSDTTHTWSAAPATTDNAVTAGADGKVDFTVIANTIWKAQVKGEGNLTKAPDIIGLDNVTQYGTNVVGSSVPMTFSYVNVTGITSQAPQTDEASPTTKGVYLWLDIPSGTVEGEYTYTLTIQIAIQ